MVMKINADNKNIIGNNKKDGNRRDDNFSNYN